MAIVPLEDTGKGSSGFFRCRSRQEQIAAVGSSLWLFRSAKEEIMLAKLRSSAAIGGIAAALMAGSAAFAMTGEESSSRLELAQATPMPGQGQMMQQDQPGMMRPGMGRGMRGQGMMGQGAAGQGAAGPGATGQGMPGQMMTGQGRMGGGWGGRKRHRMMRMRGHMMKIMFAIADQDGDGALSFEEVTNIHRRIFNAIDANHDGKVTPEEFRNFMQKD